MSGIAVWRDGAADGPTNMAADECLAAAALQRGGLVIRLYEWEGTTVSLGAFQPFAAAQECNAIAGVPLVRRPSGGGAIIHGSDMTYAAAIPKGHPWGATPEALYEALHGAMIETLRSHGIEARLAEPDPQTDAEFLCFDRRAGGDLVVDPPSAAASPRGIKLMGSAQRRLASVVLQHGSLLLRSNRGVGEAARHPSLADLPGAAWAANNGCWGGVDEWLERIAAELGERVEEQSTPFCAMNSPDLAAARARYAAMRWTQRR